MSIKKINPKSEIFPLWIILYFAYCLLIFKIGPGNIIAPNVPAADVAPAHKSESEYSRIRGRAQCG